MGEVLMEDSVLANDLPGPLEPMTGEGDCVSVVKALQGIGVAVWRLNRGFGGKLGVVVDPRSIASLRVFRRGVGSIGALCFVLLLVLLQYLSECFPLRFLPGGQSFLFYSL